MYPSGVGSSYHDPLSTNFRKGQSLNFHSGRPLLRDFKQESGHVHPLLSGTEGANFRLGKGLQYTNGIVSFDGASRGGSTRPGTAGTAIGGGGSRLGTSHGVGTSYNGGLTGRDGPASPRSMQGEIYPTSVGTPGGARRSFEGFGGATWSSRPNTAYPAYGRRNHPTMSRARPVTANQPANPPKWLALDKQMLTFEAYFKEAVRESPLEHYRVRRCVMQYFLEDDSIKVLEPREENSGIPQGAFLKRHRVPKGDGSGEFFTWRDLSTRTEVCFYGRTFRICDCDARTREFYQLKGIDLPPAEEVAEDPVHTRARSRPSTGASARRVERDEDGRRQVDDYKGFMEARLGKCQDDKEVIAQFLANDRKVLRFFAYWDDRGYGGDLERRQFRLHYFLADDTVEVLEVNTPNCGRDPWPALLKRMKLPKIWTANSRENRGFYKVEDFRTGETIGVFGRKLLLFDCDAFTRSYYRDELGIEQDTIAVPENRPPTVVAPVPPHNGIGREEDSIMNVLSLHPKPPRQNVMRRLQNKSKMLRFVARLVNAVGFDRERIFTVNYHLDTDDISIFEPPVRNSGRVSGKFMDKQKVKKPRSNEYYSESDVYVGARIHCFGRVFDLVDADLYTLNFMAAHPHLFPNANASAIKDKITAGGVSLLDDLERRFRQLDIMGTGSVSPGDFRTTLLQACPALNTQEALTLQREYEVNENGSVSYQDMIQTLASQLGGGYGGGNDGTTSDLSRRSTASSSRRGGAGGGGNNSNDEEDNYNNEVTDFEGVIELLRSQLQRRGPSGVRGLSRAFAHVDEVGDRMFGPKTMRDTMQRAGVTLSANQVSSIFDTIDQEGRRLIDYAAILDAVCGEMTPLRENACRRAFAAIDKNNVGATPLDEILQKFDASRHPAVLGKEITADEARCELADCFEGAGGTSGLVTLAEFLRVYSEISVAFNDDNAFLDYMAHVWDIQPIRQYRRSWH